MKRLLLLIVVALLVAAAFSGKRPIVPIEPGAAKGVKVFVLRDSTQPYTPAQRLAINSAMAGDIDAWCRLNCSQTKDGTPEKRVFDPDEDVTKESKFWQDAMKHDHGTLPSVETYTRKWNGPHTFKDAADLQNIISAAKSEVER